MVTSRADSRLDGLEKTTGDLEQNGVKLSAAVDELKARFQRTDEQVTALGAKLDAMVAEMRAGFAALQPKSKAGPEDSGSSDNVESNSVVVGCKSQSPMPTFDGTDALAWLARAEQYFLISETPTEKRVGVAMVALAGPALPWYRLLRQRVPDLSWTWFARELMKRFGGNGALDEYEAFAAVRHTGSLADYVSVSVPLPSPTCPPPLATVSAPLLSSSPPSTAKENTLHAIQQPLPIQQTCTPLAVHQPIPPPVLVHLPFPPSLSTLATTPTLAPVTAPLLSTSSPYIRQFQPPFSSLLRCLVSAVHQFTPMEVSLPGSLFSLADTPFYYLIMLRCFHIVGHLLWFNALATTRRHEFEPPPDKVIDVNFDLRLEGKAVSTAGAVDTIGGWKAVRKWKTYKRGERGVMWPMEEQQE